jgi:hypothetical protein
VMSSLDVMDPGGGVVLLDPPILVAKVSPNRPLSRDNERGEHQTRETRNEHKVDCSRPRLSCFETATRLLLSRPVRGMALLEDVSTVHQCLSGRSSSNVRRDVTKVQIACLVVTGRVAEKQRTSDGMEQEFARKR